MSRLVLTIAGLVVAVWLLLTFGLVPAPLLPAAHWFVGTATSLGTTFFILSLIYAPGIYRGWFDGSSQFFARMRTKRYEVLDLERKIAHLDKPHHMLQLGMVYARQGRPKQAQRWLEQAHTREPESLDAAYRLALCYFDQGNYAQAQPLLEHVNAKKPDTDYGMAYLRYAQVEQRLGHLERAAEVYQAMLRFYPGQPEATYGYALLLAERGDLDAARERMKDVVTTLRLSPPFQRRRNRHWMLRARWWLWRQGRGA